MGRTKEKGREGRRAMEENNEKTAQDRKRTVVHKREDGRHANISTSTTTK